jgi:hypothetical protein
MQKVVAVNQVFLLGPWEPTNTTYVRIGTKIGSVCHLNQTS